MKILDILSSQTITKESFLILLILFNVVSTTITSSKLFKFKKLFIVFLFFVITNLVLDLSCNKFLNSSTLCNTKSVNPKSLLCELFQSDAKTIYDFKSSNI